MGKAQLAQPLTSYTFRVVLEPDEDVWLAYCPILKGCTSWGASPQEALRSIQEAIQAYVESLQKHGEPIPVEPPEVTVSQEPRVTVTL